MQVSRKYVSERKIKSVLALNETVSNTKPLIRVFIFVFTAIA